MSDFDINTWVNQDDENRQFRQAVHVIIYAISDQTELQKIMMMKGGILLALGYQSTRFTRDIDFSTEKTLDEFDTVEFVQKLDAALVNAVNALNYGIDCVVQGWRQQPPREDATFATIQIRVGYADRSNRNAHRQLARKRANQVVKVDFSLNEPRGQPELFEIDDERTIQIYSFHDLVAEKFRALLQQQVRKRLRRQDVYDLYLLIGTRDETCLAADKFPIIHSLKEKAQSRGLPVDKFSMQNPEIIRRSQKEYALLEHEIEGPLPDFDETYEFVRAFYESLPWD